MSEEDQEAFDWASEELGRLIAGVKCCELSTVSPRGAPLASYAPVYVDADRCFYVYVSAMAKHYGHLRKSGVASLMLIEDEATAENLFARKRLTVDCEARLVPRASEEWGAIMGLMEERLGETLGYLRELTDFDLFQLTPNEGRLVLGFGKAYRVAGKGLSEIGYVGAGGHRSKS